MIATHYVCLSERECYDIAEQYDASYIYGDAEHQQYAAAYSDCRDCEVGI